VAAHDLEHPRGIAVAGLGQDSEDVSPLEADVTQEMVVQLTQGGNVPTVAGHASEVKDGWYEAGHLHLLSYFQNHGNNG
jgi:hypothetical protein